MSILSWNWNLQLSFRNGRRLEVLLLYQKMLEAGTRPNASTFPSLLGSCADLSTQRLGETIHAHILTSGCHSDRYVASSLIHMYSKCQSIESARRVFDEMPQRSLFSWTALIQGYARTGSSYEAVDMFERMQREDGIRPNAVTVLSLIPAASLQLEDSECIHACVIKLGFESNSLVATSLADMYFKCRAIGNARKVFDGMHNKNDVSWLVMVSGLAQNGYVGEAVLLASKIIWDLNLILDSTALVNLVSACADTGDLEHGRWLHSYIIKTGVELDAFVGTALLDMYANCKSLESARQAFEEISSPSLVSWNAIIHTYARLGLLGDVMELFCQLNRIGMSPDSVTMKSCLLALASCPADTTVSQLGECFHGFVIKAGYFDSEIATVNSLLDFYVKTGKLGSAKELFSCIKDRRDVISWNCLINGYVRNGSGKEAIVLFCRMLSSNMMPDTFTLSSILAACARIGEQSFGQCIHAYLMRRGYTYCSIWDSFVGTALVDMYAKCGNVLSAYKVFVEISDRDTPTWNAMIVGFGQNGYALEALDLFYHHLKTMGGKFSFASLIATAVSAFGQLGYLDGGRSLHGHILRTGLETDINVGNSVLSMYAKCGMVEDAESVFRGMAVRDATSWTAMIAGYGINGGVKDAISLFEVMRVKGKAEEGVEPNAVTFLEVLWACSHGGLVKEGWSYFEMMSIIYGIEPKLEHYCCVVDLLGRGGYLYEAYVLIRSLATKADAAVWGALLAACRIYGQLELGRIAEQELLREDKADSDYHVLLSNAYAADGWWDCALRVREKVMMDGSRKCKPPGWSQIELRG